MAFINEKGYLAERPNKQAKDHNLTKDAFLVKSQGNATSGYINISRNLSLPKEHIGKRYKLKIELEEIKDGAVSR